MRAAWQTTEFWATLVTNVVGVVALLGYVSPDQATDVTAGVTQIAGALLMLATSFGFIKGRIALRMAVVNSISFGASDDKGVVTAQAANVVTSAIKASGV